MAMESAEPLSLPPINGNKATTSTAHPTKPVPLEQLRSHLRSKVLAFLDRPTDDPSIKHTQSQAKASLVSIEKALAQYSPSEISISYNGGKDCLVLLILILACSPPATENSNNSHSTRPIQALYIAPEDPFAEVEEFVTKTTAEYHLDLLRCSLPMRAALEKYLQDRSDVKAIFMGTRRTDPFCENLQHFSPTDHGWPQFMRVNPMIDWCYADIWNFIRQLEIPYCSLYDQGYTSLGGTSNTLPNPVLALDASKTSFKPAYELIKDEEERLGRQKKIN
ncbi:hypothetical protein VHEMI06583 [[Torrubiella] hemipterigena]|uniref:FAD synthase n=1 Tax=[Torrubiella] hemipterigena TaxID=1531966 RepID=A0A0A1T7Q7_9HYPO|nr:hypothetical protein VHEMI06583 [[Torrubiella] hemipterigena]